MQEFYIVAEENEKGEFIGFLDEEIESADKIQPELQKATLYRNRTSAKLQLGIATKDWTSRDFKMLKVTRKVTILE